MATSLELPRTLSSHEIIDLRQGVAQYRYQRGTTALALFLVASLAYTACFMAAIVADPVWARIGAAIALGPMIALLFRIAHDAGHGCHFRRRRLNQITGYIAILPSYHPYRVWRLFHNNIHHAFTNLRDRDYIWVPLSLVEYSGLSRVGRLFARIYRTPLGTGLYYLVEIWAKQMICPPPSVLPRAARRRIIDTFAASSFCLLQISVIAVVRHELNQAMSLVSFSLDVMLAIIIPFLTLNWLLGYVSFLNHTHPQIPWFDTAENWSFGSGQIQCTVHMTVPFWLIFFMTDLGLHATHHIEPRVPIWKLTQTQRNFLKNLNGEGVFERWSPKSQSMIFAKCKLYDYGKHQWLDFAGKATTAPICGRVSAGDPSPLPPGA